MNKLLIICGPTATGKTNLALKLAREFNGELVSADSRQIYRGMDIGTGKDLPPEKKSGPATQTLYHKQKYLLQSYLVNGIALWMYDIVNPDEEFSISHYQILAKTAISDILSRGKLPILVGGTGFYIRSLINPPETISIPQNPELRTSLDAKTLAQLQQLLNEFNPDFWKSMNNSDRNNPRRLIRRIEIENYYIHDVNGDSGTNDKDKRQSAYETKIIGLKADNEYLDNRIKKRVEQRYQQGILTEIQDLLNAGYSWNLNSMSSLGYIEWKPYFSSRNRENPEIINTCLTRWQQNEIAYAKRQLTWFNKQPDGLIWYDIASPAFLGNVKQDTEKWYTI
jgi:tRNA dimethylallyltransferase